jgi:hypothetical protein
LKRPPGVVKLVQMNPLVVAIIRVILLEALGFYLLLAWLSKDEYRKKLSWLLLSISFLSCLSFPNFGYFHFPKNEFVHYWDAFHYYVGAKYFQELGYGELYKAAYLAGKEQGRFRDVQLLRDQISYARRPVSDFDFSAVRARFSDQRWSEFKTDLAFFADRLDHWPELFLDHAYNATPLHVALTGALFNFIPLNDYSLGALVSLDYLLIAFAFMLVFRAWGPEHGQVALSFFLLNFLARFNFIGGSILRWDWICALIAAASCLKLKRPYWAGFFLTYAAGVRIFPAVFVFVLFAKYLLDALWHKQDKLLRACLAGVFISCLGLGAFTLIRLPQSQVYREYINKITTHNRLPFANHIGLKVVEYYRGEDGNETFGDRPGEFDGWKKTVRDRQTMLPLIIGGLASVLCLALLPKLSLLEALQQGCILIYCFFMPANYYYSFLVLFFLGPAEGDRVEPAGVSRKLFLIAIMIGGYLFERQTDFMLPVYGRMSFLLGLFFAGVLLLECRRFRRISPSDRGSFQGT